MAWFKDFPDAASIQLNKTRATTTTASTAVLVIGICNLSARQLARRNLYITK